MTVGKVTKIDGFVYYFMEMSTWSEEEAKPKKKLQTVEQVETNLRRKAHKRMQDLMRNESRRKRGQRMAPGDIQAKYKAWLKAIPEQAKDIVARQVLEAL